MRARSIRRVVVLSACSPVVLALGACGGSSVPQATQTSNTGPAAAECIKEVSESGQPSGKCLPVAPSSARVDLGTPRFSKPTTFTNPLHPSTTVTQAIYGGQVDNKPFRTEVSLLPETTPVTWRGTTIDTVTVQYVAYSDGRINEVAIDKFAQADDGSVWYFGEAVSDYEDGAVATTKDTWSASDQTPPAMIMPARPQVGDVYRPENAPGVVFEEVRVDKVGQRVDGPSGTIDGAIEVTELHMDGTPEGRIFAPGYGEFSTGSPNSDLEAVALASPTDARPGPAPAEFAALTTAVSAAFEAAAADDAERAKQAGATLGQAWKAV